MPILFSLNFKSIPRPHKQISQSYTKFELLGKTQSVTFPAHPIPYWALKLPINVKTQQVVVGSRRKVSSTYAANVEIYISGQTGFWGSGVLMELKSNSNPLITQCACYAPQYLALFTIWSEFVWLFKHSDFRWLVSCKAKLVHQLP